MPINQARDVTESPKQGGLDPIASTINFGKLPRKKSLPIDKKGIVDIDSLHPDYKYWLEDDEYRAD